MPLRTRQHPSKFYGKHRDEDGWPDILVACDSTPSLLLTNNRDGTFREKALMRGVALSSDSGPMAGMGLGLGDYDLDGHLDIVRTHFQNQATGLYHNLGKGQFEDVTAQAGLTRDSVIIRHRRVANIIRKPLCRLTLSVCSCSLDAFLTAWTHSKV
jgi:hypothetical protein